MTAEQRLSRSPALPAHPLRVPPVVTSVAAEVDLVEEEAEAVVAVASMVVEADHTVEEEEDVVVAADTVGEEDMTKEVRNTRLRRWWIRWWRPWWRILITPPTP